jgi:hypothetical protein
VYNFEITIDSRLILSKNLAYISIVPSLKHESQTCNTVWHTPANNVKFVIFRLTFSLLTWTKWWAPTNASKWRMGFNSAFKGLILYTTKRPTAKNFRTHVLHNSVYLRFQAHLLVHSFNKAFDAFSSFEIHVLRMCSSSHAQSWRHYSDRVDLL